MVIMIGGNRQLDAFTGDGVHALLHGCVAMTTVGQAMNVRIHRHQTRRGHLALDFHFHPQNFLPGNRDGFFVDAVFETARGVDRVFARHEI